MPTEYPSPDKVAGVIPFFFYDVIGQITPGLALILGLAFYFKDQVWCWFRSTGTEPLREITTGYAAIIILLFFGIAQLLGVFLASISYLVERIWQSNSALDLAKLKSYFGLSDTTILEDRFKEKFGSAIAPHEHLNKSSFLCSFYIWRTSPNLGLMTGRFDAELLRVQSLVVVSFLLLCLPLTQRFMNGSVSFAHPWLWSVVWLMILASCISSFQYHRKKRVFGRFGLFLAVATDVPVKSTNP